MTQQPELVDPLEEFFAQDPSLLVEQDTPAEGSPEHEHRLLLIATGLAAAFVVYRVLASRRLAEERPQTPEQATGVLSAVHKALSPLWTSSALPAVLNAYALGAPRGASYPTMERLATAYTDSLGGYVAETSAQALLGGFQAQLNKGHAPDLAWQRSARGYGLDEAGTRTYLTSVMADKGYSTTAVDSGSAALADKLAMMRGKRIGDNEAYAASQMGKAVLWMALSVTGDLPPGTMKKWVTAEDERVCPVCAPLDGATVKLSSRFSSQGRKFHAPGVHPNCRCRIELVYPRVVTKMVSKAAPGDPYDRNYLGRFATRESRRPKIVPVKERPKPEVFTVPETTTVPEETEEQALARIIAESKRVDAEIVSRQVEQLVAETQRVDAMLRDLQQKTQTADVMAVSALGLSADATQKLALQPGTNALTGKKTVLIRRVVFVNGKPVEQTVEAPAPADDGFRDDITVVASGQELLSFEAIAQRKDRTVFRKGERLELDATSKVSDGTTVIGGIESWPTSDNIETDEDAAWAKALAKNLAFVSTLAVAEAEEVTTTLFSYDSVLADDELWDHVYQSIPASLDTATLEELYRMVPLAVTDEFLTPQEKWDWVRMFMKDGRKFLEREAALDGADSALAEYSSEQIDEVVEGSKNDIRQLINDEAASLNPQHFFPPEYLEDIAMRVVSEMDWMRNWVPTVLVAKAGSWGIDNDETGSRYVQGTYQIIDSRLGAVPVETMAVAVELAKELTEKPIINVDQLWADSDGGHRVRMVTIAPVAPPKEAE